MPEFFYCLHLSVSRYHATIQQAAAHPGIKTDAGILKAISEGYSMNECISGTLRRGRKARLRADGHITDDIQTQQVIFSRVRIRGCGICPAICTAKQYDGGVGAETDFGTKLRGTGLPYPAAYTLFTEMAWLDWPAKE